MNRALKNVLSINWVGMVYSTTELEWVRPVYSTMHGIPAKRTYIGTVAVTLKLVDRKTKSTSEAIQHEVACTKLTGLFL